MAKRENQSPTPEEYLVANAADFKDFPTSAEDESLGKWELEAKKEIDTVERILTGWKETDKGWVESGDPVINKKGISSLLTPIKSLCNKITSLTILDDDKIDNDSLAFRKDVALKVVVNRKRWGIKKSNRSTIILTLDTLMNSVLNKSKNALLVRARRQQVQVRELRTSSSGDGRTRSMTI